MNFSTYKVSAMLMLFLTSRLLLKTYNITIQCHFKENISIRYDIAVDIIRLDMELGKG